MASIDRRPNGRYRARYRDLCGKSRSKTFDRKGDAVRFLERVGADMQRGDWIDPKLRRSTIGRWADDWFQTTAPLRASTRYGYRKILDGRVLPVWADRPLSTIDRAEVRMWVAQLVDEGLAPKRVRNIVSVFTLILELARDAGALGDNPARRIRLPRSGKSEQHFLTAEEVAELADAIRTEYRFFVLLAAYTGLRPSEMCGLRVRRLDLLHRRVHVNETLQPVERVLVSGPPKTYEERSVPLPRFLVAEAETHLAMRAAQLGRELDGDDWVFGNQAGPAEGLNRDSFRKWVMVPALEAAGLPITVRTHDLRHTCASLLIQLGAHPKAIQEWLGHSDITVTMNLYGHLFPSLEARLAEGLDDLGRRASGS